MVMKENFFFFLLIFSATFINVKSLEILPSSTAAVISTTSSVVISYPTGVNKREPIKEVIYNKDYLEQLDEKKKAEEEYEVTEQPRSWIRTIYETKVEIVQPTVIAGVTFSAKPPESTNGLEPWISLNNAGVPKTVTPQAKNGNIKKGKPQYSTWFQTATTKIYDQKELKAHNMKEGSKFEEVIYLPEDETYVSLNPLIRCTPDNYYKKGKAKNILSQPFCTPRENSNLKVDEVYFITWYTKFYTKETENVKIHLSYIKESTKDKGMKKREFMKFTNKGELPGTFFTSDWILNRDGFFPLEIQESWLKGEFHKKVLITIQPNTIPDEEFDLLNSNGTVVNFQKGSIVAKTTKEMKAIEDEGGANSDNIYYVMMATPTCVLISVAGMYLFVFVMRKNRDFSKIKENYLKKRKKNKKEYSKLPQYKSDVELKRLD